MSTLGKFNEYIANLSIQVSEILKQQGSLSEATDLIGISLTL
jgi:hypothetical protein